MYVYSIFFAAFMCVILFPLAAYGSFAMYPKREIPIMVHNEDLGGYNNNKMIEPMSDIFISHYLAIFFPVVSKIDFIPTNTHTLRAQYYLYFIDTKVSCSVISNNV